MGNGGSGSRLTCRLSPASLRPSSAPRLRKSTSPTSRWAPPVEGSDLHVRPAWDLCALGLDGLQTGCTGAAGRRAVLVRHDNIASSTRKPDTCPGCRSAQMVAIQPMTSRPCRWLATLIGGDYKRPGFRRPAAIRCWVCAKKLRIPFLDQPATSRTPRTAGHPPPARAGCTLHHVAHRPTTPSGTARDSPRPCGKHPRAPPNAGHGRGSRPLMRAPFTSGPRFGLLMFPAPRADRTLALPARSPGWRLRDPIEAGLPHAAGRCHRLS